jgi:RNA polymerase II subunit A C-terminal domain phosphatase SSU72
MVRIAVVCASNNNRSMEAHHVLKYQRVTRNAGMDICSFGTGSAVRMPGKTPDKPNVYQFGTPYDDMYKDLFYKDKALYTQNGLLQMLDRNRKIKLAPQKFQENGQQFDVVITCEERCFDAAMEDMLTRQKQTLHPVHLINVEIIDNHEQALIGGQLILQLVKMINNSKDLDSEMESILAEFQARTRANIVHTLSFM